MFLWGPLVNAFAILLGTAVGARFTRVPERLKTTVLQGLAIFVIVLGVSMALQAQQDALYVILSVTIGGVIGSLLRIEERLAAFGDHFQRVMGRRAGNAGQAFVFATLVYCVGSMSILGGLQSGLGGSNSILYLKSVLDGFSAIIFTSTLGLGVGLAALPVVLYEGSIAAAAHLFGANLHPGPTMTDVTAVGGILIVGIGINILELKRVRVADLLPGMLIVVVLRLLAHTVASVGPHL